VTAVAARFIAQWDDHGATFWHAFDLALENAELWRIDQVISGVDRQQRRTNFLKVGPGS
jgi:hypothetical protein